MFSGVLLPCSVSMASVAVSAAAASASLAVSKLLRYVFELD